VVGHFLALLAEQMKFHKELENHRVCEVTSIAFFADRTSVLAIVRLQMLIGAIRVTFRHDEQK